MTKHQERAIERLRREVKEDLFFSKEEGKYEIKEFEVHENEYFVSVVFEVGLSNDEHTLASIFCRDHGQVFIGKRGGIRYPVSKNGKHFTRRFRSVLSVVIDQRI